MDLDVGAGRGDLYVPTPAEKAQFKAASGPVYDWFKKNIRNGEKVFDALNAGVAEAEAQLNAARSKDLN